jgi:hypothetical protein
MGEHSIQFPRQRGAISHPVRQHGKTDIRVWINAGRSPQFHESSDEPSPCVDIELHQAFISHFQQEGLASFFIHDIGAFHDLAHFERLLAERPQDIFSIIQHD